MKESSKKRNRIILLGMAAGICLISTAVIAVAVLAKKNPLAKGLKNLAGEIMALEEEVGVGFWQDIINLIGNENVQAEYSVNISGIPTLKNITLGLDGEMQRDMEQQLFETDFQVSVANIKLMEASLYGTTDTLYLQVPSIWDGSVVMETKNVNGQWNDSVVRGQLEKLAGRELGIWRRIDANLFQSFSAASFSASDFWAENAEALKAIYKSMEVIKVREAQKKEMLSKEQVDALESYVLGDADGNRIETTCYLAILPEAEMKALFSDVVGDIRLCVYLDSKKRIVRICTLPAETFSQCLQGTGFEGEAIALNLTGKESTIDRMELELSILADTGKISSDLSGQIKTEGNVIIEKDVEEKGSFDIGCDARFLYQEEEWQLSLEGNVRGERIDTEEKLVLVVDNLTLQLQDETLYNMKGEAVFKPQEKNIEIPSEKEYRIGDMNEIETLLFLGECAKNVYKNYSGYMKFMR